MTIREPRPLRPTVRLTMGDIADTFRQVRQEAGASQEEWGMRHGLSASRVSELERMTRDMRISSVADFADLLGLKIVLVPKEDADEHS